MKTNLIALTQPLVYKDPDSLQGVHLSPEDFIVYIARVSNPSNQLNTETGSKLIRYLIKHNHWSPFEHVSATFEIKTSRAIAAQILRHRSFTFQEFSQRYAQATSFEPIQWRMQGKTNRQVGDEPAIIDNSLAGDITDHLQRSETLYNKLIDKGIAKECARMVLPLNTSTTIYMTGTLRSWLHYVELRGKQDTQKEHRDIALSIKDQLSILFPHTFEALESKD
jgi:thymidylate synthase (FAD)